MSSQGSCTPTDQDIPTATPATSTPKPRSIQTVTPAPTAASSAVRTPSSSNSRGAMRPTLVFSSNGEPQSATRKASLAVNTIVLGGKSRVVTPAQTTPLKTVQNAPNAPEKSNGKRSVIQQVAQEKAKITAVKPQAKAPAEQTKKVNELNAKKIDVQAKQPSKLSTKKTQKPTAAVKKTVPPPPPPKVAQPKVTSKKISSRESTSGATAKPTTKSMSAPLVDNKKSMVKKGIHQIPDSPDPYDIPSPILDFTEENRSTVAPKKHNTSRSSGGGGGGNGGSRQTVNGGAKSALSDITNQSHGVTQLNRGRQHRVFNLSAAPQKKGKNNRGKNGRNSATSSLSSSPCLDDVNAIPDSIPACGQSSQEKSLVYTSFLDNELELRPPTTSNSKKRKRVRIPTDCDSFAFDSDNESDTSWKLSENAAKQGKVGTHASKPPTKKRQYKAKAIKEKPKPMLTSARTKKVATNKKEQSAKAIAKSKATATTKAAKKLDEDVENVAKKTRPPTGTSLIGRKRVIDDVYDPDFTPEFNCPKPKVTAPAKAAAAQKKAPPRKKAAHSTVATCKIMEEPAKETPSLPSMKKDAAARKLVMIQDSPKQSDARKRVEVAKEAGKKKQPLARKGKKQSTRTVESSSAHDDLYCSPAIPRISASKPDLAERAQSHSKPLTMAVLDPHSPELDLHGDDINALVCPPSPKKPRLKQRGRRSSGYFSDTCSHNAPSSPPGSGCSDHSSLVELQDNIKTNLQFVEDECEHSSRSPSPSVSCPPSPPPAPRQRRQKLPPPTKLPNLPPSPTSLHSSQVEADLNITTNFEEICRQFISQSGKTGCQNHPSGTTVQAGNRKQAVKRAKPSENVASVAKKRRRKQKNHWEDVDDEGRNSPPPPPKVVKVSL